MTDRIKKVAQLCNERDGNWADIYEADGVSEARVRVEVPREVREPHNVRKLLLKSGADVSGLDHCRGEIITATQSDAPIVHRAAHTGWRDPGAQYVTQRKVLGAEDGSVLPPPLSPLAQNLDQRGTLEGWKALIEVARYSSTAVLVISAAFAAPLLRPLNSPSFAIVVYGGSRKGKSQAQLMAASAVGFGAEEDLPTLNATPAGLIEAALTFNDCILPINEIGTARGKRSDKYQVVLDATYALTSGKDVIRHSSWNGASAGATSFKTLPILSSEYSPDEWAARSGETRDPGETARLIGVPVNLEKHFSIFDKFPELEPNQSREDWAGEQFARLREGLPLHRGVAFSAFLEAMISRGAKGHAANEERAESFRYSLEEYATNPIRRDIIRKFAVLYAGGMAAVDAGILPLSEDVIWEAINRTCTRTLRAMADPEADLKADLLKLKGLLEGAGVIDADNASTKQKRNMDGADGFFESEQSGAKYIIRCTVFTRLFPSGPRTRRVLEWLDSEGYLRHQRDFKPGVSNEWAQVQTIWPNGQRIRSIAIYIPGDLDVLDLAA